MRKMRAMLRRFWKGWGRELVIVLGIMIPFRSSIADWNHVPTGSMLPTIVEGDRILVNKLAYDLKVPLTTCAIASWGDPERGDIVVFRSPDDGQRLVKRIIGLPGDEVMLRGGRLYLNGEPAQYVPANQPEIRTHGMQDLRSAGSDRSHATPALVLQESLGDVEHAVQFLTGAAAPRSFGPVVVPEGHYFAMGDNRDCSADSRSFGFVDRSLILGRATAVVMSLDRDRYWLPRSDRWGKRLH